MRAGMSPLRPGKSLFLAAILFAGLCVANAELRAQGVLIPLTVRSDVVFDHAGKYLYITTTDGWVRRYNLATGELEPGYNLGGSLGGADIAADDSFLLVAQRTTPPNAQGVVHKLDLRTGSVTNAYYNSDNDRGSNDVALASNGTALVTSATTNGIAFTHLRQWDLAANTLTERNDIPEPSPGLGGVLSVPAWLTRSEDGSRLSISVDFGGDCFTYSALSNTFTEKGSWSARLTALNRNGTLVATGFYDGNVALDTVPDYVFAHSFPGLVGPGRSGGVAFDPTMDVLYAASIYTNEIVAYDAKTYLEQFRLPVGEDLGWPGSVTGLVASPNGHYLALATGSGIRLFAIPVARQPPPTPVFDLPTNMVFDHAGTRLYINTIFGQVWPYNLITGILEAPFDLGGSLTGMDIAPDDSFLLVAQHYRGVKQAMFQKIDLNSRVLTNLNYRVEYLGFDVPDGGGAWDVAIGSEGLALATSFGSSWLSLLQIDPAANTVSVRTDAPASGFGGTVTGKTIIHRSADGKRLLLLESGSSEGRMFTYDAMTNTFGPYYNYGNFFDFDPGAINRDGTLVATRHWDMTVLAAPALTPVRTVSAFGGSGIAFDAVRDILYSVKGSQIVAYDTNDFTEKFRLNTGETLSSNWSPFNVGNLVASQDGNYLALITPTALRVLNVATGSVAVLPNAPVAKGQLANISTRAVVKNGDNVTIAGFILRGFYPEKIFLRAIGPSLTAAGVPGALEDPTLELYNSAGALIVTNDNWKDSPDRAQIVSAGLSPKDDREACIAATLNPGAYTAVLRGKNQTSGNAVVELYDGGPELSGTNQQLGNISTRGLVGINDNVMIAGFITSLGPTKVLVRGIGPSLAAFNVPDPVQDPMIELRDSNGALILANDNWQDTQTAEIWNTSIAPSNNLESAVISTLPSGSYTAILRGKENGTGNGLVEIYQMQ